MDYVTTPDNKPPQKFENLYGVLHTLYRICNKKGLIPLCSEEVNEDTIDRAINQADREIGVAVGSLKVNKSDEVIF